MTCDNLVTRYEAKTHLFPAFRNLRTALDEPLSNPYGTILHRRV